MADKENQGGSSNRGGTQTGRQGQQGNDHGKTGERNSGGMNSDMEREGNQDN